MHVATAFPCATLLGGIVQEILQRREHERTEPSTTPIGTLEETTFKHHYKKILRQVLGIGHGMAPPADESENRSPVNFAKLGERFARILRVASRIRAGKDHAHRVVTKRSGLCPWGERAFDFRGAHHLICPIVKQAQISHKFVYPINSSVAWL